MLDTGYWLFVARLLVAWCSLLLASYAVALAETKTSVKMETQHLTFNIHNL